MKLPNIKKAFLYSILFFSKCVFADSTLHMNGSLQSGQFLTSPNGQFILKLMPSNDYQYPGSLAIIATADNSIRSVKSAQGGIGTQAIMQTDGNFVLYTADSMAVFATGTGGCCSDASDFYIEIEDDGDVRVFKTVSSYNGGMYVSSAIWDWGYHYVPPQQNVYPLTQMTPPGVPPQSPALWQAPQYQNYSGFQYITSLPHRY